MKLLNDRRRMTNEDATFPACRGRRGRGRSSRAKSVHFDTLVADLLGGAVTPRVVVGIARAVAEDKGLEDELLEQVKMHNVLCRYFADKRAEAGLPEGNCPTPLAVTIVRRD